MRQDIEAKIENILAYLECHGEIDTIHKSKTDIVPISHFNAAEPFLEEFIDDKYFTSQNDRGYFPDVQVSDLDVPMDVCIIRTAMEDISDGNDKGVYQVSRLRYIHPKEIRGKVKMYHPLAHEITYGFFHMSGKVVTAKDYIAPIGKTWKRLAPTWDAGRELMKSDPQIHSFATMACGIEFTNRYQWFLEIGYKNTKSIKVPCSVDALQEIFRLRDIVDGKNRRDALRNWVCEHMRRTETKETKVRAHLRGSMEFTAGEWSFKIIPSRYDRQLNKEPLPYAGAYRNIKTNVLDVDGKVSVYKSGEQTNA